jgi:putative DNA-binding protein
MAIFRFILTLVSFCTIAQFIRIFFGYCGGSMFWDNFTNLCDMNNISPNAVAKKIGVSNATCTKWKGGSIPNGETLVKLSEYFKCSIDYLLGKTDNLKAYTDSESETERELISLITMLTPEQQELVLAQIRGILANQQKK